MNITTVIFWVLTLMALGSAIMVITSKNPVHSILALIVTFFSISGHYILLNAQFLAIVNVIVYAGAIMVLFLFVVMLMNLNASAEPKKNRLVQFAGFISGGSLFLVIIAALMRSNTGSNIALSTGGDSGLIRNLGMELFNNYLVPFEISSVLFLSAMIGAVVIGRKEK